MSKIVALRPNRDLIRPVLMLLTSHRLDCILLCLRNLERFTALARFKKIYIVANAVSENHAAILYKFKHTHDNVTVVPCSPRGMIPAVNAVQNQILTAHMDDVIIKMNEDVFVTPMWLEHLLEAYRVHRVRKDIPIVSSLCPVSPSGRFALNRFLKTGYPTERNMFDGGAVEENWVYHRWMWEKVVNENIVDAFLASGPAPYFYPTFVTMNCVIFDRRLMEAMLPLPTAQTAAPAGFDEGFVNQILFANRWKNAVVSRSVAHHYSFSKCEEYLRSHVPLDDVWQFQQELFARESSKARIMTTRGIRPVLKAVGGVRS